MTARKVNAQELKQSGWAQRVTSLDKLTEETEKLVKELMDIPPASLAMTRSLTSALGRSASGMSMGWADADLQQWAFTEDEYKETIRSYTKNIGDKPTK